MADSIRLVSPAEISPNPENPRLIFREGELIELQESIADQGILVPLTVYTSADGLIILDGERRWRCARRLALTHVPVIVQPEPTQMQNIMMMFAIHHTRREWDPLPTAKKLEQLEALYTDVEGHLPTEGQLAQIASMTRGEVRRLKNILALPIEFQDELLEEAEKPRPEQTLTVDHVLEATRGSFALRKRGIISGEEEVALTRAIVDKYKSGVITNTVEPRQLSRIARAVDRDQLTPARVRNAVDRLLEDTEYSVAHAFRDTAERADVENTVAQLAQRLRLRIQDDLADDQNISDSLRQELRELLEVLKRALRT